MALEPRREAFRVDNIARGIDHQRTQYTTAFGDYVATVATTFEAGMLVDLDANGNIVKFAGGAGVPLGFALYNKTTSFYGSVVGEYIQLNGDSVAGTATNLAHANVFDYGEAGGGADGITVASALTGGTVYTNATHYILNATNGTVIRTNGTTTITDGQYVYVTYMYALTAQEIADEGHNFWNFDDDVTIQTGKITVITGPATIYTAQYDKSVEYTVGSVITAGVTADSLEGYVTQAGTGATVGKCIQIPTPADPFLGIKSTI